MFNGLYGWSIAASVMLRVNSRYSSVSSLHGVRIISGEKRTTVIPGWSFSQ